MFGFEDDLELFEKLFYSNVLKDVYKVDFFSVLIN